MCSNQILVRVVCAGIILNEETLRYVHDDDERERERERERESMCV
jgi:hypothetical protein